MTVTGVDQMWIYGSVARGDDTAESDTDILCVGDLVDRPAVAERLSGFRNVAISFYTWSEIEAMAGYGSLYLLHVAREGRRIGGKAHTDGRFDALLGALPAYKRSTQDARAFVQTFDESSLSLRSGGWIDVEMQILARVARHAAVLGAYLNGSTAFERFAAFRSLHGAIGLSENELLNIAVGSHDFVKTPLGDNRWRLHAARSRSWMELLEKMLAGVVEMAKEFDGQLRRAA